MGERIIELLEQISGQLTQINEKLADEERIMEPREAAEYIGVTYDTLLRWAREGIIPYSQPGGHRVLFRKKALDDHLANLEAQKLQKNAPDKEYGKLRKILA